MISRSGSSRIRSSCNIIPAEPEPKRDAIETWRYGCKHAAAAACREFVVSRESPSEGRPWGSLRGITSIMRRFRASRRDCRPFRCLAAGSSWKNVRVSTSRTNGGPTHGTGSPSSTSTSSRRTGTSCKLRSNPWLDCTGVSLLARSLARRKAHQISPALLCKAVSASAGAQSTTHLRRSPSAARISAGIPCIWPRKSGNARERGGNAREVALLVHVEVFAHLVLGLLVER